MRSHGILASAYGWLTWTCPSLFYPRCFAVAKWEENNALYSTDLKEFVLYHCVMLYTPQHRMHKCYLGVFDMDIHSMCTCVCISDTEVGGCSVLALSYYHVATSIPTG